MHSSRIRTARFSCHLGAGGLTRGDVCPGGVCVCVWGGGLYTPSPCEQNDRQVYKHYLAQTSFSGGKKKVERFVASFSWFTGKSSQL